MYSASLVIFIGKAAIEVEIVEKAHTLCACVFTGVSVNWTDIRTYIQIGSLVYVQAVGETNGCYDLPP